MLINDGCRSQADSSAEWLPVIREGYEWLKSLNEESFPAPPPPNSPVIHRTPNPEPERVFGLSRIIARFVISISTTFIYDTAKRLLHSFTKKKHCLIIIFYELRERHNTSQIIEQTTTIHIHNQRIHQIIENGSQHSRPVFSQFVTVHLLIYPHNTKPYHNIS